MNRKAMTAAVLAAAMLTAMTGCGGETGGTPAASSEAESIAENVEKRYLAACPEMKGKYCFYLCESADGLGAIL